MKRFAKNTFVMFIILISAATGLSAPIDQMSDDMGAMLPGRAASWPIPIFLGFGVLFAAVGACLMFRHLIKLNANLVGTVLIAAGAATILASGALMIYSHVEDRGAAVFSEHTAQALIEQIGLMSIQADRSPPDDVETSVEGSGDGEGGEGRGDREGGEGREGGGDGEDIREIQPTIGKEPKSIKIDGAEYIGILSIPSLDIVLPVNRTWSYPALRLTPCRYSGSIEDDSLVIAAHNFSAHFGSIERLAAGEPIMLTDVDGVEHIYKVANREVVEPSSVDAVVYSDYDLTLFTCTIGGQGRVVLRCVRSG